MKKIFNRDNLILVSYAGIALAYGALFVVKLKQMRR